MPQGPPELDFGSPSRTRHHRRALGQPFPRPRVPSPPLPGGEQAESWFREHTWNSAAFANIAQLVETKRRRNVTISLGLPALNEEKTIGGIIRCIKDRLMLEHPLLDEIVLIDSGSSDRTREIAAAEGIPVHIHQEVLPRLGAQEGKGEALWKSLFVLQGDIIVWIDTDIENIDPRFVYGLVGPLLVDPELLFVKGFYKRPIKQGSQLIPGGGGRVTELVTRPFFNLLFPELSGFIQPLSGEYAGRREALIQVPFAKGYGVETGLLIDIVRKFGLERVAQVDLFERIHGSQDLQALSRMSFAILQVILRRLEEDGRVAMRTEIEKILRTIAWDDSGPHLERCFIDESERPPMISVPEYRLQRILRSR